RKSLPDPQILPPLSLKPAGLSRPTPLQAPDLLYNVVERYAARTSDLRLDARYCMHWKLKHASEPAIRDRDWERWVMRQIRRMHSVGRPRHFVALFAALLASACVTDAAQAQNQDGGRYYRTTWNFRDIDLQTFTRRLTWIGIELPFEISGVATTR